MRYILIDRILRLEVNTSILAIKNLSLSEDVYTDHFAGYPILPGALLIESVAQAGTALLEYSGGFQHKAVPVIIEQMKFRRESRPGDQLRISLTITSGDSSSARLEAAVHNNGQLVLDGRMIFAFRDINQFYPPKTRPIIDSLYEIWLRDAEIVGGTP
jgi:3-hydroxyacyl-[acyl-carrier-protein] dehydratase